jgi:hypothetical protein
MRARFESDHGHARPGRGPSLTQRHDLRVRGARTFVETFTDDDADLIHDDSAHARIGVRDGSKGSELQGATHERNVALMLRCLGLAVRHVLPLVLDSCSSGSGARTMTPCHGRLSRPDRSRTANDLGHHDWPTPDPETGQKAGVAVATSHPDFHRRPGSFTWFTGRWMRSGRGL